MNQMTEAESAIDDLNEVRKILRELGNHLRLHIRNVADVSNMVVCAEADLDIVIHFIEKVTAPTQAEKETVA